MPWRFADLPVRTKFLVTLGIPVMGMVLLIGKQVDSSTKRSQVYTYIREQSVRIGLLSDVTHELQKESAHAVAYLERLPIQRTRLLEQQGRTDAAAHSLQVAATDGRVEGAEALSGLGVLRMQTLERRIDALSASRGYHVMAHAVLDELGRVGRLALDPETKDRLYAHLRLLHAKEALSAVHDRLSMALAQNALPVADMAALGERIAQYETNMLLFERDAPPEVMSSYRSVFQGPDINLMRSVIGTVKERRGIGQDAMAPEAWWDLSLTAIDRLKSVEDTSLAAILAATAANAHDARRRLLITLAALFGVIGAVAVMGILIMRGVRNTVNEVTHATRSLAVGDVSAEVPVGSRDEVGQMASSFNEMIHNIRALASSADAIGKGNYDTNVPVRGPRDVLGNALARMKENLKAARLRDQEQALALQEEKRKLEDAHERIQLLIKEMHHRVKNNLQVIASLLRLQAGNITDERLQTAFDQSQSRVTSMALIHEKLYKGDELATVDVALYIKELFAELVRLNDVGDRIVYHTDIDPDLAFELNTMVPLGLLFNELITNSFKHAFQGRSEGRVHLGLHRVEDDGFDLFYSDDGVGLPLEKLQNGSTTLGMSLIESLVDQLNGRMTVEGGPQGTRYHIRFRTQ
ncbi:MAG: nitrate- and nitrite sensing domain-containing protein [Flavobacteriales bacterium]|nr:nitrate- and nitrite sensing domain-containing protein [Flavobacteriales bacterium]